MGIVSHLANDYWHWGDAVAATGTQWQILAAGDSVHLGGIGLYVSNLMIMSRWCLWANGNGHERPGRCHYQLMACKTWQAI
jgi:hypothetical protein